MLPLICKKQAGEPRIAAPPSFCPPRLFGRPPRSRTVKTLNARPFGVEQRGCWNKATRANENGRNKSDKRAAKEGYTRGVRRRQAMPRHSFHDLYTRNAPRVFVGSPSVSSFSFASVITFVHSTQSGGVKNTRANRKSRIIFRRFLMRTSDRAREAIGHGNTQRPLRRAVSGTRRAYIDELYFFDISHRRR